MGENGAESTEELHFFYDAQSRPAIVEYTGAMYRYVHNLQGDIVAIVDAAGNLVVEYKYDAWGKPISIAGFLKTTLGELNLFRYRGYVWDVETELYYLRSRYYNPEMGRFVNADSTIGRGIGNSNLYTYCLNNPCVMDDSNGRYPTYSLYWNVYPEEFLDNRITGHYDISIVSETGEFWYKINGQEYTIPAKGITLSFGPLSSDKTETYGTGGRFTVFLEPERKGYETRYLLLSGISSFVIDGFMQVFLENTVDVEGGDRYTISKKQTRASYFKGYDSYDAKNGPYCGSGATFLVKLIFQYVIGRSDQFIPNLNDFFKYMESSPKIVTEARDIIKQYLG